MRRLWIAFFLVFVAGCSPFSDNPLTDPNSDKMDSSLYGTWFAKDKDETGYLHVGLNEKTKLLRVISVEVRRDGKLEIVDIPAHTSSLAGNQYLNLKVDHLFEEVKGYVFVKYKTEGDSLEFSWMEDAAVKKAIKDGVIRGIITKGEWVSSARITDEQTKLQEFILKYDKDLFKEKQFLYRLKLPGMPSERIPNSSKREGG